MFIIPGVADSGGECCDSLFVSVLLVFKMGAAVGKVNRILGSRARDKTRGRKRGTVPALNEGLQHCQQANKIIYSIQREQH